MVIKGRQQVQAQATPAPPLNHLHNHHIRRLSLSLPPRDDTTREIHFDHYQSSHPSPGSPPWGFSVSYPAPKIRAPPQFIP
ncbi:hypothetical protein LIER_19173 [Lithospermum erythrorhizon]|uniref:Uncharacterized protein n=1 Tax=Lithospermum erythrorhizon TaxID=34254 RepID=A0AAV3QKN2_LITER